MRDRIICLSFILLIFLFGIFIDFYHKNNEENNILIRVTVKGAVVNQGVYFCKYGVSIGEILEKCGGLTDIGCLPYGFDYNMPITNDIEINIQKRYSTIRKNYEEN